MINARVLIGLHIAIMVYEPFYHALQIFFWTFLFLFYPVLVFYILGAFLVTI